MHDPWNFVHLENLPGIDFVSWPGDNRFACLCKNPRSQSKKTGSKLQITWDNPKELEVYIGKLQAAAEKLSTENRKLRKWHTDFIEKVLAETQYLNFWPLVQFFATTLPTQIGINSKSLTILFVLLRICGYIF